MERPIAWSAHGRPEFPKDGNRSVSHHDAAFRVFKGVGNRYVSSWLTAANRRRRGSAFSRRWTACSYRHGLQAVGVDAIVAELGISKKTLYRHFPSKDDLIVAYLKGRFRPLPESSSKPPAEQILNNFEWFARSLSLAEELSRLRLLERACRTGRRASSEARKLAVEFKESRRLWYRELLSQLEIDDPDMLATQLALLIDGAYAARRLVRRDPSVGWAAAAAARVLLKNAGVPVGAREGTAVRSCEGLGRALRDGEADTERHHCGAGRFA